MNIIDVHYESQVLHRNETYRVIIPSSGNIKEMPVLLLLHGYTGNYLDWSLKSDVSLLADEYKVVFIMPSAYNSFYNDIPNGEKYYTAIVDEILPHARELFNLTNEYEKTMVAGLSMGGYGALKIGLANLSKFRYIGSFSGCVLLEDIYKNNDEGNDKIKKVLGPFEAFNESISDIAYQTRIKKDEIKELYIYCGTSDFLYEPNVRYLKLLAELKIKYYYYTDDDGHTWQAWNKNLHLFLKWALKRS